MAQVQQQYTMEFDTAYKQWNARRQEFERARLNYVMPNRNNPNHRPHGTPLTKVYASQPDASRRTVAFCVADIVDTAIAAGEGRFRLDHFQEEFHPPQKPDIHSNPRFAQNKITEERLRKEYTTITSHLRASEDERQKSWKKMLKVCSCIGCCVRQQVNSFLNFWSSLFSSLFCTGKSGV